MTEAKTLWLVTEGSYSSYRVTCAAPDEATARAIADGINSARGNEPGDFDEADVCEVEVWSSPPEPVEQHLVEEWISDEGVPVHRFKNVDRGYRDPDGEPHGSWWHDPVPLAWLWSRRVVGPKIKDGGLLQVRGTDRERVHKVFGELRRLFMTDPAMRAREHIGRGGEGDPAVEVVIDA